MKATTANEYRSSIHKAVRLLESRLDDPPDSVELAREACMSTAHFHRIFKGVVGESVVQYSQRLRLDRAAALLKFSNWPIQDICLSCGFDHPSSFARAFRRRYASSPQAFRTRLAFPPFLRGCTGEKLGMFPPGKRAEDGSARIETWLALPTAALRYFGPVSGLASPWGELVAWARATLPDPAAARYFGLWFDDWSDVPGSSHAYRYEAAVSLPPGWNQPLPAPFHHRILPQGQVAWAETHGSLSSIERAWKLLAHGWLPYSGYQPCGDFAYDEYPAGFILSPTYAKVLAGLTGLSIRMCLPVQRRKLIL